MNNLILTFIAAAGRIFVWRLCLIREFGNKQFSVVILNQVKDCGSLTEISFNSSLDIASQYDALCSQTQKMENRPIQGSSRIPFAYDDK